MKTQNIKYSVVHAIEENKTIRVPGCGYSLLNRSVKT